MAIRVVAPTNARQARLASLARVARSIPHRLLQVCADRARLDHILNGLQVRTSAGTMNLLSPKDVGQLREIFVSCQYAERHFIPRSGWVVMDVGSNLGFFTAWCLSFMRSGTILGIEAVPATFRAQDLNIGATAPIVARRSNVRLLRWCVAVSDASTPVAFAVSSSSGMSRANPCGTTALPAARLDAIVRDALGGHLGIDLIKVDIEGMEAQCFRGGIDTLQRADRVVFEYHGPQELADSSTVLSSAGLAEVTRYVNWHDTEIGVSFWRQGR